jgi:TrmH family RNA methyltransferase
MKTDIRLEPYKKDLNYSYSYGVFPTLELLNSQKSNTLKVLLSSKASRNTGVTKIKELCNGFGIKTEISDGIINKLAGKGNCYAVGVFNKYKSHIIGDQNHLVLVGIRDAGNLGTILRTMLGFNLNNLAIIKPAIDIFQPKVVRASMGAIFHINFQYFDQFEDYQKLFTNNIYTFMTDGDKSIYNVKFNKPYSLIFGSEAGGLDKSFLNFGQCIQIPQSSTVDSLNLSVAVGIALYEAQKTI